MKERTSIYIDGFNLYYGVLKNTTHKWLDLQTLFSKLLNQHQIVEIKYFTARVSGRDNDPTASLRQKAYLSALEKYSPEIKIFYGHYLTNQISARTVSGNPRYIDVFKTEEKGSDVNLAIHLLNDAWKNKYDCAILVSNDSDLAEALRLVKTELNKKIGIIFPGNMKIRKPSKSLSQHANFIKEIRTSILAASQLPNPIPGTNIYKPRSW